MPYARGAREAEIFYEVREVPGTPTEPRDAKAVPTVVLLQGLGLSSRFWFDLPDRLINDTEAPYRVVLMDNRGVGKSRGVRPPYRMAAFADDVAAVLDATGTQRAVVAGISMGGMIAQHVALRHPERVSGLVLLATGPGLPHGRLPHASALRALLAVAAGRGDTSALAPLLLPERELHRAPTLLAKWPAALLADPVPRVHFAAQLLADAAHSTGFALHQIGVPTIVVTGDDDVLMPPDNSVFLARKIPRAELHVLRGVGHGIPLLDEDVLGRALRRLHHLSQN